MCDSTHAGSTDAHEMYAFKSAGQRGKVQRYVRLDGHATTLREDAVNQSKHPRCAVNHRN